MVVFAVQNVTKDPPFTRLDLLACRNLMIYLEPELQDRLISTFHYALRAGGVLFLSPSESLGHGAERLQAAQQEVEALRDHPVGERVPGPAGRRRAVDGSGGAGEHGEPREEGEGGQRRRAARSASLLSSFAPASVVTDQAGDIVYVHGDTGRYLRPAPGKATLNVMEMARGGLEAELRAAFHGVIQAWLPPGGPGGPDPDRGRRPFRPAHRPPARHTRTTAPGSCW